MQLKRVYVRFYKSFNFDYERRARPNATRHEWELIDGKWYPHVRLDVDPQVTAVVGANESGKTHLLDAIECITGKREVKRSDFCRHSQLYSVERNEIRLPDVGAEFEVSDASETETLASIDIDRQPGSSILFMRPGSEDPFVVLDDKIVTLDPESLKALESAFPTIIRFSTEIAIPDSVPIARLWGGRTGALSDRRTRSRFLDFADSVEAANSNEFSSNYMPSMWEYFSTRTSATAPQDEKNEKEIELARQLLLSVAEVDPTIFKDLHAAISNGHEGDVSGLIEKINQNLSRHLNLSRWWSQDAHFALRVSPRERELVFTIRDRTGTEYSFGERSRGLTHFLAYFVQLRAHQQQDGISEILLMDEPDAFLSNSGQQDLLRVLENFAVPDDQSRSDQVVYVTHSPFLINKNAAHRLRVLDKGDQEEGTRVVKDVVRTHYEPLRSSLGGYVAETAFIGGANLIVEGVSDQVLLAGMSSALRVRGENSSSLLDLNAVTIVPAGSADSVPYIAYLARGRDPIKPPCVALLDGDEDGRRAAEKLRRSEASRKPVLSQNYILQLDKWALQVASKIEPSRPSGAVSEIEDLVPVKVAIQASRRYAANLAGVEQADVENLREARLNELIVGKDRPLWDALREAFAEAYDGGTIDKVGFAREVVAYYSSVDPTAQRPAGVPALEKNFLALLETLSTLLTKSAIEESERRRNRRMGRVIRGFLDDYRTGSTRSIAESRLREIEAALDDIAAHDSARTAIVKLRRDFKLMIDPMRPVDNFGEFKERLGALPLSERLAAQDPE